MSGRKYFLLLATLATMGLGDCGSGRDDDSDEGPPGLPGTIWFSPSPPATVTAPDVELFGDVSCPNCPPSVAAFGTCLPLTCPDPDVDIHWINETTGFSGVTSGSIHPRCGCLFSHCVTSCKHIFSARFISLAPGKNSLRVDGIRGSTLYARERLEIERLPKPPGPASAIPGPDHITVTWEDSPEAVDYNLYWANTRITDRSKANRVEGVASPFFHGSLPPDRSYYYAVAAELQGVENPRTSNAVTTTGWTLETVFAPAVGGVVTLSPANEPQVFYWNFANEGYLATRQAGVWTSQYVADAREGDIDYDPFGVLHLGILFFPDLTHWTLNGGILTPDIIDQAAVCCLSADVDSAGAVHFAYIAGTTLDPVLRYSHNSTGSWQSEDIGNAQLGQDLAMAVDGMGNVHLAYVDLDAGGAVSHAVKGAGWPMTVIDPGPAREVALALDNSGTAHVVYSTASNGIFYAHDAGGDWTRQQIVNQHSLSGLDLAIDSNGKAHISFNGRHHGEFVYATNKGGSWRSTPLSNDRGLFTATKKTSIALDTAATAHIAFVDGADLQFIANF